MYCYLVDQSRTIFCIDNAYFDINGNMVNTAKVILGNIISIGVVSLYILGQLISDLLLFVNLMRMMLLPLQFLNILNLQKIILQVISRTTGKNMIESLYMVCILLKKSFCFLQNTIKQKISQATFGFVIKMAFVLLSKQNLTTKSTL